MRRQAMHDICVMLVLIGFAFVIFYQTRALTDAPPGQLAPATFPRLAAGALAAMAALKLVLGILRPSTIDGDHDWHWRSVYKPLVAIGLMLAYYWSFKTVPFDALNAVFLGALFVLFGVRPLVWALGGAALATLLLHLLFVRLLQIPV